MSSVFVTSQPLSLTHHLGRILSNGSWTCSDRSQLEITTTRLDNRSLWGPASNLNGSIQVYLGGRIALDESDWKLAFASEHNGGHACKWILDAYLKQKNPIDLACGLNGAFLVVILDQENKRLHLWTDRMGAYAVYQVRTPSPGLILGTHPDILAQAYSESNSPLSVDWTTVAECLRCGSGVQPYTYYKGIEQLEPGSYYCWNLEDFSLVKRLEYWRPEYEQNDVNYSDAQMTEELAYALDQSVKRRTHEFLGRVGIMLSGGADSRAALFATRIPSSTTCFTFFDEPNEELTTAGRLATIARAQHIALQRDRDYYAANSEETIALSGGMWSLVDSHFLGFQERILLSDLGVVLTGCYADYMFKGLGFNRGYKTLLGRCLPLRNLANFDYQYYHGFSKISSTWEDRVNERLAARFPDVLRANYQESALLLESLRLRPLSREADATGRATLTRGFPWDPFLLDNDVVQVFGRMNAHQKMNGIIFGRAVTRLLPRAARKVPNNNYGTPVDASELARAFWFVVGSLKRKLFRKAPSENQLSTTGSWPNFRYYISNSATIAKLWGSLTRSENECFENLLGYSPESRSLEDWARIDTMQFLRLFNLLVWMRSNNIKLDGLN